MIEKKKAKKIAFDFDGVIAKYEGFKGASHTEEPICEVVKAMRLLRENGYEIIIYSTRGNTLLKEYCKKYDIPADYINENPDIQGENPGKPIASVYVDDRAVCYRGQSAEKLIDEIINFKAYWE